MIAMASTHHDSTCAYDQPEAGSGASGGLAPWRERLAKQMILTHLAEGIPVARLAEACALSRSHFARAFKCTTGMTPQDWLRRQRLARAKELIRNSDLSLTRISLECGFYDQAHFSRLFTRAEGVNPMSWRLIGE
ncbi:hypothetical protein PHLH8_35720 [Pseudomonas sp. Pc102]|nr:hypothetical protein PHLH8_35720 [Pseudomonas sp. Pc102]